MLSREVHRASTISFFFFFNDTATTEIYTLSLHDALPIYVTAEVAPELVHPGGMITAAVWIDFDGDGRLDLVTAGEWVPVQFYYNQGGRLRNVTAAIGLPPLRGWGGRLPDGDFYHHTHPCPLAGHLG